LATSNTSKTRKPHRAAAAAPAKATPARRAPKAAAKTAEKFATKFAGKKPAGKTATGKKTAAKKATATKTSAAKKASAATLNARAAKAASDSFAAATKRAAASKPAAAKKGKKAAVPNDPVERLRLEVKRALEDLKAKDVAEIDVRGKTSIADYLVVASGTSNRHVKSIAEEVIKNAKATGSMPLGVEGQREAEWVLVDLGDIVVHVMLPRVREFYGLERLWSVGAEHIEAMRA
jgi:ribosome silencing factor RsfS/YbeB/iojap